MLTDQAAKALDTISETYYENEAMFCYWNEANARDMQAHIQKTFKYGRFSRDKRLFSIRMGRWYCAYKQAALRALGQPLDF
jgi:hypothetical protein